MSIPVLLFASYADAFGARRLELSVPTPCSVTDLVGALRAMPGGEHLPANPLVAINHEWVHGSGVVNAGDEVAVIPPVAGG
jgi:molybdopterin converting factor small subunit